MTDTLQSRKFTNACVKLATRASRSGYHHATMLLLGVVSHAMDHPHDELPLHHYTGDLRRALWDMFGHIEEMGGLSNTRLEEALQAWTWFNDETGADLDIATDKTNLFDAVTEYRIGGKGWHDRARAAL